MPRPTPHFRVQHLKINPLATQQEAQLSPPARAFHLKEDIFSPSSTPTRAKHLIPDTHFVQAQKEPITMAPQSQVYAALAARAFLDDLNSPHSHVKRSLSVNKTQQVTLGVIVAYVVAIALLWNLPYVRWSLWPFKVRRQFFHVSFFLCLLSLLLLHS